MLVKDAVHFYQYIAYCTIYNAAMCIRVIGSVVSIFMHTYMYTNKNRPTAQ